MQNTIVKFKDLVYGDLTFPYDEATSDPVLVKSDGWPTYHLASVVDDHSMGISHVLRGEVSLLLRIYRLYTSKVHSSFSLSPGMASFNTNPSQPLQRFWLPYTRVCSFAPLGQCRRLQIVETSSRCSRWILQGSRLWTGSSGQLCRTYGIQLACKRRRKGLFWCDWYQRGLYDARHDW